MDVNAYAALNAGEELVPFTYRIGDLGPDEIDVQVKYCGICHSDLSMLDNEWNITNFPFVGGHEIVGEVIRVGSDVNHLNPGQTVGIGWTSASCKTCDHCISGDHNFCRQSGKTIVGRHGGFADKLRVQAIWAFPLPASMNPATAGPLFCGGITVFNPLIQHSISPMDHVGVVGIGGLGHMAIKFLNAWGCEVTAFSTSPSKEGEAKEMGAHHFVATHDKDALKQVRGKLDMVIDTVNVALDWDAYLRSLRARGVLHIVGVADKIEARVGSLMGQQKAISASPTGSPASIRNMLTFAARHDIQPTVERYKFSQINEALERLRSGKTRYRIVLEH